MSQTSQGRLPAPTLRGTPPAGAGGLLRIRDVIALTRLSRATIYRMVDRGEFPRQVPVARQAVAWSADAVNAWVRKQITLDS